MVQLLLILVYGSIYYHDGREKFSGGIGPDPTQFPLRVAGITLGGFFITWLAYHLFACWCGRQLDRSGRAVWARTADRGMTFARIAGAAWWCFALFELGWLRAVRTLVGDLILIDELLAMSPFLCLLAGAWWSMFPVDRRFHEALFFRAIDDPEGHTIHPPPTRVQSVWMSLRHQVLLWMVPLSLMMGWQEFLFMENPPQNPRLSDSLDTLVPGQGPLLFQLIEWIGMLTVVIVTPAIMRFVWDTVAIGPGPLRDQVQAMCRQYRVRVGGPLLWRTRGSMVNGAILGVVWPLRYMLLTDALLERLSPAQVEGVMAHEVAHVRRRHLIWLAVSVISTVIVCAWAIAAGAEGFQKLVGKPAGEELTSITATVISLGGAALVFGLVSRRFEWQADAFAVQHLSRNTASPVVTRDAALTMASALQAVADLNGILTSQFSWRHGSIRQRQARLLTLVDVPIASVPIDRQVRFIKLAAALGLALGIGSMVIQEVWIHLNH